MCCIKIFFKACLYNGLEQIGEEVTSKTIESEEIYEYHYLTFKQKIEFKVKISELHRSSKLCLTLNYLSKKNKVNTLNFWVLNAEQNILTIVMFQFGTVILF